MTLRIDPQHAARAAPPPAGGPAARAPAWSRCRSRPAAARGADGEPADVVALAFTSPTLGRLDLRLELRGEKLSGRRAAPAGRRSRRATGRVSVYAPNWRGGLGRHGEGPRRATRRSTSMPDPDVTAALRYTGGGAPRGRRRRARGHVAATILARAHEAGVPVHRDPELADALARLALGSEVPEAMWTAVAEVLAWAYGLQADAPTPNR